MIATQPTTEGALRDSRVLYELADEVCRLDDAIALRRDHRDALRAQIRGLLIEHDRKSVTVGGIDCRLVPVSEVWCLCHAAPAVLCESAREGKDIAVELRQCEPFLVVKRRA